MYRFLLTTALALIWAAPSSAWADCVCFEPGQVGGGESATSSLVLWSDQASTNASASRQFYSQHYSQSVEGAASVGGIPLTQRNYPIHWSSLDALMSLEMFTSMPAHMSFVTRVAPFIAWSAQPRLALLAQGGIHGSAEGSGQRPVSGGFVLVCTADSSLCVPLPPAPTVKDTVATGASAGAAQNERPEFEQDDNDLAFQLDHARSIDTAGPSGFSTRLFRPPA